MCKCGNSEVQAVEGCLNGSTPVVIHYDYTRDTDPGSPNCGDIIGVDIRVTDAGGTPVPYTPATDVLSVGACPIVNPNPGGGRDWEYMYYDDRSIDPLRKCRKIMVRADSSTPPMIEGFELSGVAVDQFDPALIKDDCGCAPRVPAVAW